MMTAAWVLQGWGGTGIVTPLPPDTIVSPASIVAQFLIDNLILSSPSNDPLLEWPVYVNGNPASGSPSGSSIVPAETVGVFDTAGVVNSKDMNGKAWEHEGITILVRCEYAEEGSAKARQIRDAIDPAGGSFVTIGDETWKILNVNRSVGVATLGQDPETRETLFSVNARVSLRRV